MPIDKEQICLMWRGGYFRKSEIAKRLGCSVKTVQRVIDKQGVKPTGFCLDMVGTEDEIWCWYPFYLYGESIAEIAYRFGVSRQAVYDKVDDMEKIRLEGLYEF
jgi:transposase